MISRYAVLTGVVAVSILALALRHRIPQDPEYHLFADRRSLLGIPNFWNVISNVAFLLVGAAGFAAVGKYGWSRPLAPVYFVFFLATILISFGSAYYHLAPDNRRLTWDRLPMALAFMAFLVIVVGERIDPAVARQALPFLLAAGAGSVAYWRCSELRGRGDLRPYLLVQYLPLALAALITLLFPAAFSETYGIWGMLVAYVAAKIAETMDEKIFGVHGQVSGHTLKHLTAAAGVLCQVLAVAGRPT